MASPRSFAQPELNENGPVAVHSGQALQAARAAQPLWQALPVAERVIAAQAVRRAIADKGLAWAETVPRASRRSVADTLAAEVLPLADACRFLLQQAPRLLRPRREHRRLRTRWVPGVDVQVDREPWGVVLIIGTWNYPLLLMAVQALQALVAGNAVLIKPGAGGSPAAEMLARTLHAAGIDPRLVAVLDESSQAAETTIALGVDKIVLTGSRDTGTRVLHQAAEHLTPCTLELSGCDAVFVQARADVQRAARCLMFGLTFNGSATCIAPRRVFVNRRVANRLKHELLERFRRCPPLAVDPNTAQHADQLIAQALRDGAERLSPPMPAVQSAAVFRPTLLQTCDVETPLLQTDLFAPVMTLIEVDDDEQALAKHRRCPLALGAAVFGPRSTAPQLAKRIEAGCVTINDLIVPTADPRVSFGGWKQSGYGVTRGSLGLLEMTRPKTIITQRSRWLPQLEPQTSHQKALLLGILRAGHAATFTARLRGALDVVIAGIAHRKAQRHQNQGKDEESGPP